DPAGRDAVARLGAVGRLRTALRCRRGAATPFNLGVTDARGRRIWFAHEPGLAAGLQRADLAPLATAALVYVDAYPDLLAPARRALAFAHRHGRPAWANVGQHGPAWAARARIARAVARCDWLQVGGDGLTVAAGTAAARRWLR